MEKSPVPPLPIPSMACDGQQQCGLRSQKVEATSLGVCCVRLLHRSKLLDVHIAPPSKAHSPPFEFLKDTPSFRILFI